ncbi:MAG: formylglycine-generating enzyme family protein [Blastochloris sp.]|nr:formylglycine-generating enzyme family protein [Blastochloris sp.]
MHGLQAEGPVGPEFRLGLKDRVGIDFVWVEPIRAYVGKYEVTQEQYETLIGKNPSHREGSRLPVETVSWVDAVVFCKKLTVIARHAGAIPANWEFTLPTDKQWEVFVGNAQLSDAVTSANGERDSTEPVGSLRPNNYGLYDVRGNVWEWCADWYDSSQKSRVLRGASWGDLSPERLAVSCRLRRTPDVRFYDDLGFRVILKESKPASPAISRGEASAAPEIIKKEESQSPLAPLEARALAFVREHLEAMDSLEEVPRYAGHYAQRAVFHGEELSREEIAAKRTLFLQHLRLVSYRPPDRVAVHDGGADGRHVFVFTWGYHWFHEKQQKELQGTATDTWLVQAEGSTFRILGERQEKK